MALLQNSSLEADLVASIYEAAVINDRWPSVFAQISALFDLAGGGLAWESPSGQVWMGSDGIQGVLADFAAGGWGSHNERLIRANREGQFSFVQDVDLFTEAEMNSLPIYRDFLHPRGFGYGTGTLITGPLRTPISVVFERKRALGPLPIQTMQILDRLRPHFARSLVLTSEIERQRAETLLSGLSVVGLPAAVIRDNGQILAANSLFITAQQRVVIQAFDRLIRVLID